MATSQKSHVNQAKEAAQKQRTVRPVRQGPVALALQAEPLILQRAVTNPRLARPADMLALQRTYGNRAVTHLIQTKLMVGPAGDKYEREADRVAEQVMNMPAPAGNQRSAVGGQPPVQRQAEEEEEVQTKPLAASITPLVQRQAEEEEEVQTKPLVQRQAEEEEEVQTKPLLNPEGGFAASSGLERRLAAHKGSGSPLPEEVRTGMEARFGADFSGVRVHTGGEAVQMNKELSAQSFTHGQDIYFGVGHYDPESEAGKRLLAHELTHTLQQGAANHIRGWWPKGHREVTELAIQQGGLDKFYEQGAQDYLIDRSPDMDFIQDQIDTMNTGIEQSKSRLDLYEHKIKTGQVEEAKRMYNNNELHFRRPAYMLSHGEGGRYKEEDASAENEAMTSRLVDKAVGLWETDRWQSLSVLSDALHQAEDRGSHGEGNAFTGHDVRNALNKRPWEIPHYKPGWEPDNAAVNRRGLVLAIGFAQGVLKKFRSAVGASEQDKIPLPGKELPAKREVRARPGVPKSTSKGMKASIGVSWVGGETGGETKALKKIFEETKEQFLPGEYEAATETPQVKESLEGAGFGVPLREGLRFYEEGAKLPQPPRPPEYLIEALKKRRQLITGEEEEEEGQEKVEQGTIDLELMTKVGVEARRQFAQWAGRGTRKSTRKTNAENYYRTKTGECKDERTKELYATAIKAAYEGTFGETLNV